MKNLRSGQNNIAGNHHKPGAGEWWFSFLVKVLNFFAWDVLNICLLYTSCTDAEGRWARLYDAEKIVMDEAVIYPLYTPVSYTHLDVYKRQVLHGQ